MWLMVITSEWKRGLFAYQHPFRCCAIWKIQLLHKFALFQIEYFTGAQQTWEYFKIFYNLLIILVFDFAFSFQITLQEIIALLNVSRFMQHLVKLHIKTLKYITSMIIPPNCIFLVAELIFLNMWHLIEILLFSSSLTKKMPTCVNFLKNVKCITASLNVCPSPLKALLSGLFCLQLFSGTPLNRTGPPNHFLLNYLFLSPYLTSISFCFLDKCI